MSIKGLRQFLDDEQQRSWIEGEAKLKDADERTESLELRFKYADRFQKLLRRPRAEETLEILRIYGENCVPIPRTTERFYWSVSCLPSTSDKPLARVNASWMELFTLLPDGDGIRARFILHLSDFTTDGSSEPEHLDQALIEQCVEPSRRCQPLLLEGRRLRHQGARLRLDPHIPRGPPRAPRHP